MMPLFIIFWGYFRLYLRNQLSLLLIDLNKRQVMSFWILQNRIKGSVLWEHYGFQRLYFPTRHINKKITVKSWFEAVNDEIDVQVKVSCPSGYMSGAWCRNEAARIRTLYREQYQELMQDCEIPASHRTVLSSLKDDTFPTHSGSMQHQAKALSFLCTLKVAALFGDSGIGKTKPAIDLANSRYLYGKISKVLVLCSCITMDDFKQQIKKWQPHPGLQWKMIGIESIGKSNDRFYEGLTFTDRDTMIIIDKSHLIKSPDALRSIRIQQLCNKCTYKLLLSATPVTENPGNLYMQYAMLDYRITGYSNWEKFARQFILFGGTDMKEIIGYKNLNYLASLIAPYTYQIKKEDCLTLPSKTFCSRICGLTDRQNFYYQEKKEELLDTINRDELAPETIMSYLTQLQQIACGFRHVRGCGYQYLGSLKFPLLEDLRLDGQVIFFCKYLFEADMLMQQLGKEHCACFTGLNKKYRNQEKQLFMNGGKRYFVATTGSGACGLDGLTVSNKMVFLSKPFRNLITPCISSMDRPGQTRQMFIYDLRTNAGIDRLIDKNIGRKQGLEQQVRTLLSDKTKLRQYAKAL